MFITHVWLGSSSVFPHAWKELLESLGWAYPSWEGSWGACSLGLTPCSSVIPAVLSGEESASPTAAPEVP